MSRLMLCGLFITAVAAAGMAGAGEIATVPWKSSPSAAGPPAAVAQEGPVVSLKDRLEKGLKLRRPVEFAFVAKVVKMVDAGELPQSLVDSTFLWARRQDRSQPFPYFKHGLRLRAEREGIDL